MKNNSFSKLKDVEINSGAFVFKDIFEVYNFIKDKGWNIGWYAGPQFGVMKLDEKRCAAVPLPINPLYRGQNTYFEPCQSSLHRKSWSEIENLERLLQIEDFKNILKENPEIKDTINAGLDINYIGLAQHYGIETHIIDLTNSFGVAAFFATSQYDPLTDTYFPILEYLRKGIIYFLGSGGLSSHNGRNKVLPIGMESLPRPGEQRGYGVYLDDIIDFNNYGLCKFHFWHNPQASMECFNRFHGGTILFPYDPMAEKVRCMRKYRIYGKDSLEKVIKNEMPEINLNIMDAEKLLIENGCIMLSETPFHYTKDEIDYITKRYHKTYPGSFADYK